MKVRAMLKASRTSQEDSWWHSTRCSPAGFKWTFAENRRNLFASVTESPKQFKPVPSGTEKRRPLAFHFFWTDRNETEAKKSAFIGNYCSEQSGSTRFKFCGGALVWSTQMKMMKKKNNKDMIYDKTRCFVLCAVLDCKCILLSGGMFIKQLCSVENKDKNVFKTSYFFSLLLLCPWSLAHLTPEIFAVNSEQVYSLVKLKGDTKKQKNLFSSQSWGAMRILFFSAVKTDEKATPRLKQPLWLIGSKL